MTIDIIPKSLYPLVPNAPGVPAVLRGGAQVIDTATGGYLGLSDALNEIIGSDPVKWGIFDASGAPVGDYDSLFSLAYRNDSKLSDYPVEQGGFASYNKVDSPYDNIVTVTCGGTEARRAALLVALEAARKSLQLYSIFTPEATYQNSNITGIDMRREIREGANMLIVNLTVREVRQKASASFSEPKNPSSFDAQSQGQVQSVDDPTFDASGVA